MASPSRIRQTVLRLMGLFNSSATRLARSVVDWRLKGFPVRATTSQAMEATMALSRGGKDGLAASSGSAFKGELTQGPALPPAADTIGVKVESGSGLDIGKRGRLVQQQDQMRSLPKVRRCRASQSESSRLGEKVVGEGRAVQRCWSRHET